MNSGFDDPPVENRLHNEFLDHGNGEYLYKFRVENAAYKQELPFKLGGHASPPTTELNFRIPRAKLSPKIAGCAPQNAVEPPFTRSKAGMGRILPGAKKNYRAAILPSVCGAGI
ncbi:hypothetical protein BV898_19306 [Hypsibius exemplaris]|uniref:Uncharacterized protein n=1 Tax=Hypsibius exemplaris TaxID=2072580 RepID=A0A9X6NLF7_HYPEX|nr:hypothetical protein BV898_19306 [Hypsibius exemplaris]